VATAYRAFISYSHRDERIATWLHRSLEAYRVPSKAVGVTTRVGRVPLRLTPVFRDREELPASSDLGSVVTTALESSMFLIVICSPSAVASRWVDGEILAFKRTHGEGRILALIVDGEPNASSSPATADKECFPHGLRYQLGADGELSDQPAEPIAADLRPGKDGKRLAKLKLVAGLTGLGLDDLVQRENQRRVRNLAMITAAAVVGMIFAIGLAIYANQRRIEANEQRQIAERESATARAASDFLVGTFVLSNPATENPRTITAFTILDRSAQRIQTELAGQPMVQARLIDTLGQAYNNLGLFNEARDTIERSSRELDQAGPAGAGARVTLAATYFHMGKLDKALDVVHRAQTILTPDTSDQSELLAKAASMEGVIHGGAGDIQNGIIAFNRALDFYRRTSRPDPHHLAATLQDLGMLLSDDGQFTEAERALNEALTIARRSLGEHHLLTAQVWYALGLNAFLAGKLPVAETRIAKALIIERQVLDPDNPIIADALSMQGQIFQGEKKLSEAKASLEQSIALYRRAFKGPHYQIGITEIYLALVESDRGHTEAALHILEDAKHNYDVSYGKLHANHGDLLVNRATILAHAGRISAAKQDCAAGLKILGRTLGEQANYTKSMAAVCAKI